MAEIDLQSPELLITRELSWLEFNDRVLREGLRDDVPLLERLKFLAIVSSNLDEFYMIRVAGLKQARLAGVRKPGPTGLTPAKQLAQITERVRRMVADQSAAIRRAVDLLEERKICLLEPAQFTDAQRDFLADYFERDVQPALTPIGIEDLDPKPLLPGLRLHLAVLLREKAAPEAPERIAIVPIPRNIPRFVAIPAVEGLSLARLEDVIRLHLGTLFPGREIQAAAVFRITRDSDVAIDDDDASEMLQNVEEAVRQRVRRRAVRLELSAGADGRIKRFLRDMFETSAEETFEVEGMLDARSLMDVAARPGNDQLKYEAWPPQPPRDLLGVEDIFAALRERDVMLFHPYESFDPVVEFVQKAADDPQVLAIKQTLYRTAGDSPVVDALLRAARNGKQVTALVELKARFDEARNVSWARALEDAGCDVIYGVAGLKTHAKMLLVIRREEYGVHRYLHLSTGNYNDKTARLYSDIALMTCDRELTADASAFFNLLTGYSQQVGWSKLTIAPTGLRGRLLELIDREIRSSTKVQPGMILAKINSLQDPQICRELYRAGRAGVKIRLNVRGVCCLRPGVAGVSDNIEVVSIIDRYLEHSRIFYFRNGGHEEVYLSSADWMERNLDRRLETLFPITDHDLARRLVGILQTFFADNVKARRLLSDGTYEPVARQGDAVRAQQAFYTEAVEAARAGRETLLQFRPLRKGKNTP
jgi:polyphosphate kinase